MIALAAFSGEVAAAPSPPESLAAFHRAGQTFITWREVAGAGVRYRIFRSPAPILSVSGLTPIGEVADSTAFDRRAREAEGTLYRYRIAPGLEVPEGSGLFVHTPDATGASYYAVTSVDETGGEDPLVVIGDNSLAEAVAETLGLPRPVLQRILTPGNGLAYDIYSHWASDAGTALYPSMCVLPSRAFNFTVGRREEGSLHPVTIDLHSGPGFYYWSPMPPVGTGQPAEWVITLDDAVPNDVLYTHWYGCNEKFDWETGLPIPESGVNVDFTVRRVAWTLDWALGALPIDPERVYLFGNSMGGAGAAFLGHALRDRVAARYAQVPKLNYAVLNDSAPNCSFNTHGPLRAICDRLWGTVATNLPCSDGMPTYERLDIERLTLASRHLDLPPLIAVSGRNDATVGWTEKIGVYAAFDAAREPCTFYWDSRQHSGPRGDSLVEWAPMDDPAALFSYRLHESVPAFSRCSANGNAGDGKASTADRYGAINAHLTWRRPVKDTPARWEVFIEPRDLESLHGLERAPDTIRVDVTPRRLQSFSVIPGKSYQWEVRDGATEALLATGSVPPDAYGLVTIPSVLVTAEGALVTLLPRRTPPGDPAPEPPSPDAGAGARIVPNPSRGPARLLLTLPQAGDIRIAVFDAMGRRIGISSLLHLSAGPHDLPLESLIGGPVARPAPGVYLYRVEGEAARALGPSRSGRWTVLR